MKPRRLQGWQPVTWFLVADVDVEAQNDDVGEQSGRPVDDKHDHAAEDGSRQRHPHVVVLEAGPPTWSSRERVVEQRQRGTQGLQSHALSFHQAFKHDVKTCC